MTIEDATAERVLADAARDESLPDGAFVLVARALRGVDLETGEPLTPTLPARMESRGWRYSPCHGVETGQSGGSWYWRCRRKSCGDWGGPYRYEGTAGTAGREAHACAHARGKRDAVRPTGA